MNKFNKLINYITANIKKEKNTKVVFLGHHKSGTTAISALLAQSAQLSFSSDPIYTSAPQSSDILKSLFNDKDCFIKYVYSHQALFFQNVVKEPDFIFSIKEIIKLYSGAAFAFIVRNPHQIIRSICNRLSIDGNKLKEQKISYKDMANGSPNWDYIVNGDTNVSDGMTVVERLAHRVENATLSYLNHRERIILVKYEDFLLDKTKYINRLAYKLALEPSYNIEKLVDKQFQPVGDRKVLANNFFGEKNYDLITKICHKTINEFNY